MDILLVACVSAAFMAVAGIAFAVGQLVTGRNRLQRRLPASARISGAVTSASNDGFGALVAERFTEDRFGIGGRFRQELRLKMVRAGYFSQDAVRFYVFARVCAIIAVPSIVLASCVLLCQTFRPWSLFSPRRRPRASGCLDPTPTFLTASPSKSGSTG